ncbi:MAG: hypothetical protein SF069_06380 [Phycisphaerae bacterium]|nr:hypothetical protein [Phycisphaerae bacterium]
MSEQELLSGFEAAFAGFSEEKQRAILQRLNDLCAQRTREQSSARREWWKRVQELREQIGPIRGTTTDLIREIRER